MLIVVGNGNAACLVELLIISAFHGLLPLIVVTRVLGLSSILTEKSNAFALIENFFSNFPRNHRGTVVLNL